MKKTINPIRAESIGFYFMNNINMIIPLENSLQKFYNSYELIFNLNNNKIINREKLKKDISKLSLEELDMIYNDLEYITNLTKEDEIYLSIDEIFKYYKLNKYNEIIDIFKEIPYYLSKFNNKKNFIPSLKSIMAVLNMMIQTIEVWRKSKITDCSYFNKFERIILYKLNHDIDKKYYKKECSKNIDLEIKNIDEYKRKISSLYEFLIDSLEKDLNIYNKDLDNIISYRNLNELNYIFAPRSQKIKTSYYN